MGREPEGEPTWHRSCDSGACVELAALEDAVVLRSSVAPDATLTLSRAEWAEFLAGAKEGLFDHL